MATYESKKYSIPGGSIRNIAATAVADGSVTDAEYQFINTLGSNAQTQIDAKLPLAGGSLSGNISLADDIQARFGAGNDLRISHSNSAGADRIESDNTLQLRTDTFRLENAAGTENIIAGNADGAVTLYHNDSAKIVTSSAGASVTGTLSATTFSGSGASLSSLNASNLSSGTVPAARLPSTGKLLKVQTLVSGSGYNTTSVIPFDTSTPTISEGIEVMSQSYTPVASNSKILHILSSAVTSSTNGKIVIWSIFNGSSNIGAFANSTANPVQPAELWNQFTCQAVENSSGNTSARTYSVRFGVPNNRGHWLQTNAFNARVGSAAVYTIMEIAP